MLFLISWLLRVIINGDSAEATSGAEKCEKTFAVGYKCALVPGSISCEKYALYCTFHIAGAPIFFCNDRRCESSTSSHTRTKHAYVIYFIEIPKHRKTCEKKVTYETRSLS